MRTRVRILLALLAAAGAVVLWSSPSPAPAQSATAATPQTARGAALFADGCSSCHGDTGRGVPGRGPSLVGAGAAAADFYLSTGRMPLAQPGTEPRRADPAYDAADRAALVAFVAGLGDGPAIPAVDPARGSITEGRRLFADSCSGCHQIVAKGGIGPGFVAPSLDKATPRQIAEAIRVGPYVMPSFPTAQLDDQEVDSIVRFISTEAKTPDDRGGLAIGNVGPIPEGLVAWLLAGGALLLVIRLIGERTS